MFKHLVCSFCVRKCHGSWILPSSAFSEVPLSKQLYFPNHTMVESIKLWVPIIANKASVALLEQTDLQLCVCWVSLLVAIFFLWSICSYQFMFWGKWVQQCYFYIPIFHGLVLFSFSFHSPLMCSALFSSLYSVRGVAWSKQRSQYWLPGTQKKGLFLSCDTEVLSGANQHLLITLCWLLICDVLFYFQHVYYEQCGCCDPFRIQHFLKHLSQHRSKLEINQKQRGRVFIK